MIETYQSGLPQLAIEASGYVPVPELDAFSETHPITYPGGAPIKVRDQVDFETEAHGRTVTRPGTVIEIRGRRAIVATDVHSVEPADLSLVSRAGSGAPDA